MKRLPSISSAPFVLALTLCLAAGPRPARILAAEPAKPGDAAAAKPEPPPPERKIEFVRSTEEVKMSTSHPEPTGQKYYASFQLEFDLPKGGFYDRSVPETESGLQRLLRRGDVRSAIPLAWESISERSRTGYPAWSANVESLAKRVPPSQALPRDVVAGLVAQESLFKELFRFGLVSTRRGNEQGRLDLFVMGETPERTEQHARDLLTLVDRGFLAPTLREFTPVLSGVVKDIEGRLLKARARLAEAKARIAEPEKQLDALKPFQDVTPETLPNFISQQRMIAVDMAGVRAKIAACDKLLKDEAASPRHSKTRDEQVETAKIMAEIELVGLTAKHTSLEEIVREGRKRIELTSEVRRLRERASSDANYVAALENIQKTLTAAMIPETFFGQVVDASAPREGGPEAEKLRGKILIRPIRWTTRDR